MRYSDFRDFIYVSDDSGLDGKTSQDFSQNFVKFSKLTEIFTKIFKAY